MHTINVMVQDWKDSTDNEFPKYTALFIFDNSPPHKKMNERSLKEKKLPKNHYKRGLLR